MTPAQYRQQVAKIKQRIDRCEALMGGQFLTDAEGMALIDDVHNELPVDDQLRRLTQEVDSRLTPEIVEYLHKSRELEDWFLQQNVTLNETILHGNAKRIYVLLHSEELK